MNPADPFNLSRFVDAQKNVYEQAMKELRRGKKESHWMWFIFPQLDGLGSSSTAKFYAIKNADEARDYLNHSVLGPRLIEGCDILLNVHDKSASEIFGFPDDMKLKSCVTLFSLVSPGTTVFKSVLNRYFGGEPDSRTVELLRA